jgi:hypothetical protein
LTTFNETAAQILGKSAAHPEHVVTTDEGTVDLHFFDARQNQFLLKTAPHESGDKIYCQIYVIGAPGETEPVHIVSTNCKNWEELQTFSWTLVKNADSLTHMLMGD